MKEFIRKLKKSISGAVICSHCGREYIFVECILLNDVVKCSHCNHNITVK